MILVPAINHAPPSRAPLHRSLLDEMGEAVEEAKALQNRLVTLCAPSTRVHDRGMEPERTQ